MEGKSSFADMGFGVDEAVCKCAFTVAAAFIVSFMKNDARIELSDGRTLFTNTRIELSNTKI